MVKFNMVGLHNHFERLPILMINNNGNLMQCNITLYKIMTIQILFNIQH